jgi:hypothetical protein
MTRGRVILKNSHCNNDRFHNLRHHFQNDTPACHFEKVTDDAVRKVKNELLLVHHKSRSSSSLRLPQLLFHFWSHIAIAPRSPFLCTSLATQYTVCMYDAHFSFSLFVTRFLVTVHNISINSRIIKYDFSS